MTDAKSIWFFIVNPHAGSGKTMRKWVPAEQKMETLGLDYETAYTSYKRHATELARKAAADGYRRICAVGGDGSVHEALEGILSWCEESGCSPSEFTLAVMPIGSGNDWIKGTKVPNDPLAVVDLIASGSFGKMDVVRVRSGQDNISYMANVGGVGFDSQVCVRVNLQKERGMRSKLIYILALIHTIRKLRPIEVQVIADGQEVFCGRCYSIAMGNGPFSGGGMRQVPLATFDDGIIDFMIVPVVSIGTILKEVPRIFLGNIHKSTKVKSFRCHELQILPLGSRSACPIELDGEIKGNLPMSATITGDQINILKG